jgi:hypothetical protein
MTITQAHICGLRCTSSISKSSEWSRPGIAGGDHGLRQSMLLSSWPRDGMHLRLGILLGLLCITGCISIIPHASSRYYLRTVLVITPLLGALATLAA